MRFLNEDVSELCLGKPELRCVTSTATVSEALAILKTCGETHVSVWTCRDVGDGNMENCICIGKICVADVILFLCRDDHLNDPFKAFEAPVSDVMSKGGDDAAVRLLEPNSSLLEAIDCILEGTQNLVIPIQNHHDVVTNSTKKLLTKQQSFACTRRNGHQYCWLTQEDIIRFLLNSIRAFSQIATFTIDSLDVINRDIMAVHYNTPASSSLAYFYRALTEQTSVAVVDEENRLIGEISPFTLASCDETAAAAIMALSAVELMTYLDCGGPSEDMVQMVKTKLEERKLGGMSELMDESFNSSVSSSSSCCSSDDELGSSRNGRLGRCVGSGRQYPARRSEAVVCSPRSSLVAVMIQALAHRVSCVWVVEDDHTVVGTVTFARILKAFRSVASSGRHSKPEVDNSVKH